MTTIPEAVEVALPGGFAAGGEWHRKVWLRPWNGVDAQCGGGEETSAAVRTTAILARCLLPDGSAPAGSELVRGLSVGDREALLLHLRRITLGDRLDCVLTCPACKEKMDLELSLSDLLLPPYEHSQSTHSHTLSVDDRSYSVRFRLPTGADQEAVAELATRDAATAAHTVLKRCIEQINGSVVDPIPAAVAESLPKVMAELDPQAEMNLRAACPACQAEFEALFDTALFVHQELDQAWRHIHREVHLLASHYHWSEADILAMSDSKRLLYIELVREEARKSAGASGMSNFLVNLVRRGAGIQRSIVPRTLVAATSAAATDREDLPEVVAEELPSETVEPATQIEIGRPSDTMRAASRLSNTDTAEPEETSVSPRSDVETLRRDAERQSAPEGLAQETLASSATPATQPEDLRPLRGDSEHDVPTEQSANAAEARPNHANSLAAGNSSETSNLRVEPRDTTIVVEHPRHVDDPAFSRVVSQPQVTSGPDVRRIDDVSDTTSLAGVLPQPPLNHAESAVARPVERFPETIDREAEPSSQDRTNDEINAVLKRLEALTDRLEAKHEEAQPPRIVHVSQPKQRASARGFADLGALRRHVDRKWY